MTTTLETNHDIAATSWLKLGFYTASILFNVCLIVQVLTVGVAYFTDPTWWNIHVWLVRGYGIHLKPPLHLEVLHPLSGFTLFYVSSSLVHCVAREVFIKPDAVIKS